jgi:hypothetical protein
VPSYCCAFRAHKTVALFACPPTVELNGLLLLFFLLLRLCLVRSVAHFACPPTVERNGLLFSVFHINSHIKQNLIFVSVYMLMDAHALSNSLSLSLSLSHTHTHTHTQHRYWYWECGGRYAWRAQQALLCARSIKYD